MTAPAECVLSPFLFDASNFDSHVRYLIALTSSAPVAQMTSIFHESPLAIKSLSLRHSPQRLLVNETKAKGLRLADLMNRNHCCCLIRAPTSTEARTILREMTSLETSARPIAAS